MIRSTIDRVARLGPISAPIIVTNADHAKAIRQDLSDSPYADAAMILEPVGRNTAPAVAAAALEAMRSGDDPLLLVLPSDHTIGDEDAFIDAINLGIDAAAAGSLVTFGIHPSDPNTGYGYIRVGETVSTGVHRASEFREKPDFATACAYLESGDYLWNSGMFLFTSSVFLAELANHDPVMLAATKQAWQAATRTGTDVSLDQTAFASVVGDSIDYAVMEKTLNAAVVPVDPKWSDVGSWASLWDITDKDEDGNVLTGDTMVVDVRQSYVRGSGRLIAVVGMDDVVIVDTPDALLVTSRDRAQDVKQIVDRLVAEHRPEIESDGKDSR